MTDIAAAYFPSTWQRVTAPYFLLKILLYSKKSRLRNLPKGLNSRRVLQFVGLHHDPGVYLIVSVFFRVLSRTQNLFGCVSVCACLGFPLFACGFGMKGPGGLVGEARADVSWPVGTRFSRIRLPSQAGFWRNSDALALTLLSLLPIPLLSLLTPASLSASSCLYVDLCTGNALEAIRGSF